MGRTTPRPPGKQRVTDWVGMRLKSKHRVKNGWAELPAGTLWTVTYARSGLSIESDACSCCGIKVYVRGVDPRDFEVLKPTTEESP